MDIFQCLRDDHRQVMVILDQIEGTTDSQRRSQGVRMLMSALLPHAAGEETLVYPLLRDEAGDAKLAEQAMSEHHQARMLINQIAMMDCQDRQLITKVRDLRRCLKDHVEEEEGRIFDELRTVLSEKQATEIGRQFVEFKEQCRTSDGQTHRRAA